ncbi:glutathione peroxidase [Bacillus rubiinfantis]|uniref:glutathione peroxidase n=1 Tax=Bacillus rubiinfantis TaxID=1499680 RepID=UPI0005A9732B|nr:glutathione peroxidase [Bacillus rubiinfantis]
MTIYQFSAPLINGEEKSLMDYKGKVLLIVNTATKCGFAPQLRELQELHDRYSMQGFEVLGFPCNQFKNQEPGSDGQVAETCQINFGVTFPLFKKINVKGEAAHPLYRYLTKEKKGLFTSDIKWNFTKFLIDKGGNVFKRYAPTTSPLKIEEDIKGLLK